MCWEEDKLGHQKDLGSSSGLAPFKLYDCGQIVEPLPVCRCSSTVVFKITPLHSILPFSLVTPSAASEDTCSCDLTLGILAPSWLMFLSTAILWWSAPRLAPRCCLCSFPTSFPCLLPVSCFVCLPLMDEWLPPLRWTPRRDLCLNFMPACLVTFLRALPGCLKGTSNAVWPEQVYYLPLEHLFFSAYFLCLWMIAPAFLLHKPQIYGTSLMLSSPSPSPIHHPVRLMLSTECLFSPSTSVHIPWLLLDPAFFLFLFFLVDHPNGGSSFLPSFWL